jgi:hypothetical protein
MEISDQSSVDGVPIPHRMVLPWRRRDAGTAIECHQATKMMPGRAVPVALVREHAISGEVIRLLLR